MNYSFPGNVRELKSLVELAVTLAVKEEIEAGDFAIDTGESHFINDWDRNDNARI